MRLTESSCVKPFTIETVQRPWGYFGLYSNNEPCTCKILYIKKGESLSLQYHFKRDQFYMSLDDGFIVEYSSIPVPFDILNEPNDDIRIRGFSLFLEKNLLTFPADEGAMFGFHRYVVHRATYTGTRAYGRVLDLAFGVNDESDIIRLKDNYGRSDI